MYTLFEFIGTTLDTLQLVIFLNSFLFLRENRKKFAVLGFISFALIFGTLSLYPQISVLRMVCSFIIIVLLSRLFFEVQPFQSLFISAAFCALYALVDILCIGILMLMGLQTTQIMQPSPARVVFILLARFMMMLFLAVLKVFSQKQNGTLTFKWILPLLPGQIFSIIYCVATLKALLQTKTTFFVWDFFLLFASICMNIVMIFYIELVRAAEASQKQYEIQEQQYEIQLQYYQRLYENQEETRALWHDIKKYLSAIQTVESSKEKEQTSALIQEVTEQVNRISPVADVGNDIVNAILDSYIADCKQLNIKLSIDILIPPTLTISPIDLYVIFGNTLDNAVQACNLLPQENRWIKIKMRKRNQIFFYEISNSKTNEIVAIKTGTCHGYGLKNVEHSVKKYSGQMTIKENSEQYTVSIRINC